jgi:L-ascorbate metabolism protein UlaG (beta-lactamase superfamily)
MSRIKRIPGDVHAFWNASRSESPRLAWLGQAGFLVRHGGLRLALDPYLTDYLEKKYRLSSTPHRRMMPAPIGVHELDGLDYILCTHRHSDHMDPEGLPELTKTNPGAQVVVPAAEAAYAQGLGLPADRLITLDAGHSLSLAADAKVEAIPAAHELLEYNERGECRYLGYILQLGDCKIYHSGDTVSYPGLNETLLAAKIDLALLPVNGRGKGVAGNFTMAEALALCRDAAIPNMVPHHFGMFAFNTPEISQLQREAHGSKTPICHFPDASSWFQLEKSATGVGDVSCA